MEDGLHCIRVPVLVRPYAQCCEQNAPGCTPEIVAVALFVAVAVALFVAVAVALDGFADGFVDGFLCAADFAGAAVTVVVAVTVGVDDGAAVTVIVVTGTGRATGSAWPESLAAMTRAAKISTAQTAANPARTLLCRTASYPDTEFPSLLIEQTRGRYDPTGAGGA